MRTNMLSPVPILPEHDPLVCAWCQARGGGRIYPTPEGNEMAFRCHPFLSAPLPSYPFPLLRRLLDNP